MPPARVPATAHLITILFLMQSPVLAERVEDLSQTRIRRPHTATGSAEQTSQVSAASSSPPFKGILAGMSNRWWRKLRNPSFCPYVLCGGSCADISGTPRVGAYSPEELQSDITPCSLEPDSLHATGRGCCMRQIINQTYTGAANGAAECSSDMEPNCCTGCKDSFYRSQQEAKSRLD